MSLCALPRFVHFLCQQQDLRSKFRLPITPVETLPALRVALFIQNLDQVNYSFNPGIERMLGEVHDLRALISRMPTIRFVSLDFISVDAHFMNGEPQVLNPEVWKREFQGLLDLILEKGCYDLCVQGGVRFIEFYTAKCMIRSSHVF